MQKELAGAMSLFRHGVENAVGGPDNLLSGCAKRTGSESHILLGPHGLTEAIPSKRSMA